MCFLFHKWEYYLTKTKAFERQILEEEVMLISEKYYVRRCLDCGKIQEYHSGDYVDESCYWYTINDELNKPYYIEFIHKKKATSKSKKELGNIHQIMKPETTLHRKLVKEFLKNKKERQRCE